MRDQPIGGEPALPPPTLSVRCTVLVLLSVAMFGNYYFYDCVAPLADLLKSQRGFTDTQIGWLNAIYSVPNIVMVLIGGIIVDRFGTRRVVLAFTAIFTLGAVVTAAAPSFASMAAGRLLFGLGAESMIVAVTASLGQWFKGRTLGLAFGLNLGIARGGSYAADWSPTFAKGLYDQGWQAPLWFGVAVCAAALAAAAACFLLERAAERRFSLPTPPPPDRVAWRDLLRFDRSYWYVVGLCVTFYSVIFPFRSTFAIKYFMEGHGLSRESAGQMNSWVFLAAIFATPAFGLLADRVGRRALLMAGGSLLLLASFPILLYTDWSLWVSTALLGVAYSLVPAVLWPSIPYLVGEQRLGTALGLMNMLQNVGLTLFNYVPGALNDAFGASAENPDGYRPMLWMFALLSLFGLLFAFALRVRERGPHGHDLEHAVPRAYAAK